MSAFTTDAGLPAVSSDAFAAALFGAPAPDPEPAAPAEAPAPPEADATPPAQEATETPAEATAETPAETPPATEAPKDELAELKARLAQMEEADKRRESQYSANVRQQREAMEAAQRRADEAEKRLAEESARVAKAAEDEWNSRVAQARERVRTEADPGTRQWLESQLQAAIQQHDAEQRLAEANRLRAEAEAKEQRLAPVFAELTGLQQQLQVKQTVDQGLASLTDQGAQNLAAETGVPVEEVRAYLQRPAITERLSRALALTTIAQLTGQPVPTVFQDLGEQIRDHFVDLAAARTQAEAKLIASNQRALAESGATRGDGGGGGTPPPRQIRAMADVTADDFARALGIKTD